VAPKGRSAEGGKEVHNTRKKKVGHDGKKKIVGKKEVTGHRKTKKEQGFLDAEESRVGVFAREGDKRIDREGGGR